MTRRLEGFTAWLEHVTRRAAPAAPNGPELEAADAKVAVRESIVVVKHSAPEAR